MAYKIQHRNRWDTLILLLHSNYIVNRKGSLEELLCIPS